MIRLLLSLVLLLATVSGAAEQKVNFGQYEIHYIVIPTTFLRPDVAAEYELTRGRDRSLVNVSVLDASGTPVRVTVTGYYRNLLGQDRELEFHRVVEGPAIYYLAVFKHGNEEHLDFQLTARLPDNDGSATIDFQQKMYWEE